ncbi:MAG: preprotein translocase subunit SecG [Nitrospirales bacterium]|nr:preprotein translocase subunit SecG [Nitrospirales bacterium]
MATFIMIIHILVCIFLILIVLLQSGKGAEMGATFGGSSQTLFGSRGASTFLNKLTTVAAVVFMLTSLTLAMVTTKSTSVMQRTVPAGMGGGMQKAIPGQGEAIPQGAQQPMQQAPQQQMPQQPMTK